MFAGQEHDAAREGLAVGSGREEEPRRTQRVARGILPPDDERDGTAPPGAMGAIKATLVSDLYRRYYSGLSTAQDNAAFQIALYEITHENLSAADAASALAQLDLTRGAFQTSASAEAFQSAADMLASLGEGGFKSVGNNLRGLTNATAQDQLLMVPVGGPAILAGLGLLGVGVLRRRMK